MMDLDLMAIEGAITHVRRRHPTLNWRRDHHPLPPRRPKGAGPHSGEWMAGLPTSAFVAADLLSRAERGVRDPDRQGLEHERRGIRLRRLRDALPRAGRVPAALPGTDGG